jgi:hypothetical protein
MKTIKVFYNKTLNMSAGKIASQCCHAVAGLVAQMGYDNNMRIVILGKRATAFFNLYNSIETAKYMQIDLGFNEVEKDSQTSFAYLEK